MAKFKVYYTIELNEVATHIFESNDFEVKLCSHNDEETYVKELAEFQPDAIMCRTEPITAKMMDTCKNLKVIGKQGAGLDNIDMDHAHAKDITVVYAPAGNANAVAEHAVMLMLMCAKRFTYVDRQFRGGNFLVRMGMEHTYELGGKTLGMIGCGRISQLAMQKCKYVPHAGQDRRSVRAEGHRQGGLGAGRLRVRASARRSLHRALHRP